jgi:hypothetical protein
MPSNLTFHNIITPTPTERILELDFLFDAIVTIRLSPSVLFPNAEEMSGSYAPCRAYRKCIAIDSRRRWVIPKGWSSNPGSGNGQFLFFTTTCEISRGSPFECSLKYPAISFSICY